MADRCSHGVLWDDNCLRCDMVGCRETLGLVAKLLAKTERRLSKIAEHMNSTALAADGENNE